ncbi:MAG: DUF2079 domain-containing protein [Polyangiaceae bacterium]|nr:DUF2079 domain-containing protein [Polyangiaceae bacterium]
MTEPGGPLTNGSGSSDETRGGNAAAPPSTGTVQGTREDGSAVVVDAPSPVAPSIPVAPAGDGSGQEPTTEAVSPSAPEPARDGPDDAAEATTTAPAPSLADAKEARATRWGVGARSITLSGLIVMAMVALGQLSYQSDWVTGELVNNELSMPQRMAFIISLVGGLALGALGGAAVLLVARRKGWAWEVVERYNWFLSPVLLLPLLPQLLRVSAWHERHEELLTVLIPVILVSLVVLRRSFESVPEPVTRLVERVKRRIPPVVNRRGPFAVVLAASLFYVLFFSFYTVRWHYKLRTHNFDVGINDNLLFGGLKGVFMHSTVAFPDDPGRYLGAHAKVGGYLFLPLYALYPHAETLLVTESALLGLGALPLFGFARRFVSDWAAALLCLAYVCYYPMHSANFYEVNHVPMAAFFVLATAWAAEARRWVLFSVCFLSALLMREDLPIGLAVMGGFMLLAGHRPVAGLVMAAVSSVWFVVLRFVVMDAVADWWFPSMYKELWAPGEKGFVSVLKTLVTNPLFVFGKIMGQRQLIYLLHLFVPIAFLPVRRWYLWAAFVPGAILTLLATEYKPVTLYSFQYVMHWTPYLFLAAALALGAIAKAPGLGKTHARAALGTMLLASFVLTFNYGAFPRREGSLKGGYFNIEFTYSDAERRRHEDVLALRKLVPPDASVVATENVGPHFSSRLKFYALRRGSYHADYLVAERDKLDLADTRKHFRRAVTSGEYGLLETRGRIALFKRGYSTAKNAKLIAEWQP